MTDRTKCTAPADRKQASNIVRLLAGISSPVQRVAVRSARELLPLLPQLEELVTSNALAEMQLRELWRLKGAAVPGIVRMLTAIGPNCEERARFLIEALHKIANTNPELLIPHREALQNLVLSVSTGGYTFWADRPSQLGKCLGMLGECVDKFVADSLRQAAAEILAEHDRPLHNEAPLRIVALTAAAQACAGPECRAALWEMLDNMHACGPALTVLFELGDTRIGSRLTDALIAECASGARLRVLRLMLSAPRAQAEPFAEPAKACLQTLVCDKSGHHDVRGTALSVLFRFFFAGTMEFVLEKKLALVEDAAFLNHLVRSVFASDGILEERQVKTGGFRLVRISHGRMIDAGEAGGNVQVHAVVVYEGAGSRLSPNHVTIAEQILSHGPTEAASLFFGLLGEGIELRVEDVLCVDLISRESSSDRVFYHPVSLLGTEKTVLDQLVELTVRFIDVDAQKAPWRSRWELGVCGSASDYAIIHALRFLVRCGAADAIRRLATKSGQENIKGVTLSRAGKLAGQLEDVYRNALRGKQSVDALHGLISVLPAVPEAASIIRRHGRTALFAYERRARSSSGEPDLFTEIARRAPALAALIYEECYSGGSGIDFSHVTGLHGSGDNDMEGLCNLHFSLPDTRP